MAEVIYEFIPFEKIGDITFNETVPSLIEKGFFIPDWWEVPDYDPTQILYTNPREDISVYFDSENRDKISKISCIKCEGLMSYKEEIITDRTNEEIEHIFGQPDSTEYQEGAFFNDDTEREDVRVYERYGVMAFFRRDRLFSIFASPLAVFEDD